MKDKNNKFLYERIETRLIAMIREMSAGARLPARPVLSKQFGVTRTTIDKAIDNLLARNLLYSIGGSGTYIAERKAKSKIWGVIIPNILDETDPLILKGITDYVEELGILLLVSHTDYVWEKQEEYIREMMEREVDGLIILPAVVGEKGQSVFNELRERDIPFVFCQRPVDGIQTHVVSANFFHTGFIGTDYLVKSGCDRIVLVQPATYSLSLLRYQGFLSAMEVNGLSVRNEDIWMRDPRRAMDIHHFTQDRLKTDFNTIGFMCYTAGFAVAVHEAARQMGYAVGARVRIIGEEVLGSNVVGSNIMGNETEKMAEELGITTIKSLKYAIGFQAAELLHSMAERRQKETYETRVIMPEIIRRESCGEKQEI